MPHLTGVVGWGAEAGVKLRIAMVRESLRTSLWFIPALCSLAALAIAEVSLQVDDHLEQDADNWFLFGGGADSARAIVSTIGTSMLTFTGIVFSVTMLVLQLASGQLSPRVMRTFLRDRHNQLVLGVFIATFLYSLLVLRRIRSPEEGDPFVPGLSIWLALVLVILCLGLFIWYINHMAQAIRVTNVLEGVYQETVAAIDRAYPADVGEAQAPEWPLPGPPAAIIISPGPAGVLTGIDEARLASLAEEWSVSIELRVSIGDYLRDGAPLFHVWGRPGEELTAGLQGCVTFAAERTMWQDPAFGFRQLVDIADRALSPGVNDPTTAVQALDRLHGLLGRLATRTIPSPRRSLDGGLVVILPRPDWDDYVALACDEIRRWGRDSLQVQRRLRAMLDDLLTIVPDERRPALEEQRAMLDAQAEAAFDGVDLARARRPSAQGHGPDAP